MIKSSSWAIEMKMFILLIFQNMKAIIDVFSSMHDESWLWHRRLGHCEHESLYTTQQK